MEKHGDVKYTPTYATIDCTAYCKICGKTVDLKKGAEIPLCCGQVMSIID
jgi:endogenous inhibitor of DNA gyrase (YacG/DUF329 family)